MSADPSLDVALAALQRQTLPGMGPHSFQAQYVRYQGSEVNTQGCWSAAHSPGAAEQGNVADFVGLEVLEAPAEWAVPARVDRYIKPPFKVRLNVGYHGALSLPVKVKACLLTEPDIQDISTWDPLPAMNDAPSVVKLSYTSLKGEVVKSHVIKASPELSATLLQLSATKDCSSCSSIQEAMPRPSPETWGVSSRIAAGTITAACRMSAEAGSNGHPAAPHSPMMEPSSNRQRSLDASNESLDSLHGRAATSGARDGRQELALKDGHSPLSQQQVAVHEMAFADLRFAKPSRMHPVYLAFCCTLPFCEDTLFTLFTVPTVVTCRAEQSAAALKRLGHPPDLLVQANILRGNGPSGSGSADKDRCSADTSSGSGSKEDENQGGGRAATAARTSEPLVVPQPPGNYPSMYAEGQPNLASSPTPFVSPAICVPTEGPPQARLAATISAEAAASHWQGGYGVQAPEVGMQQQLHGAVWPHSSGCSSSTWAAGAGGALPPQQQPQAAVQAGGGGLGSNNDGGSVHNGSASMQDMQQHLPSLPPLAPSSSGVASPQMPCMMGGCPVLSGHELSPAGLAAWLEEEYDATGLARRLTPADVQTLVARSGLVQGPADPMHQQQLLAHFTAHMRGVFGILKQISSLWNQTYPVVVVAGFEVGREDAARLLARQPLGTFVCRISLSGAGGLALAVRAFADHPQAGPDGIVHVLMTAQDLHMRRADTVVRDLPGATHLLDLYSCKRVDKRKIFATNYTHLKKLEHVAEPALGATFSSNGNSSSRRPMAGSIAQQCNAMGSLTQQQAAVQQQQSAAHAAQARQAAQAQLESTMTLDCPLLVMPGLDGLGASMAIEEAMPTSCDAPLAATPPPLPSSPVPLPPPTVAGKEPAALLPTATNIAAVKSESSTLPPQPPTVAPPASVPIMYPSLTLDILDQGACAAMLNDSNKAMLGPDDNRDFMEAPLLRGTSPSLDRGASELLDSLQEMDGATSSPLPVEGTPTSAPSQQQYVLHQQVPTLPTPTAAQQLQQKQQQQRQLLTTSAIAPMQLPVCMPMQQQQLQLPMDQDLPTVLLNNEEQSMVDMLMDG